MRVGCGFLFIGRFRRGEIPRPQTRDPLAPSAEGAFWGRISTQSLP